MLVSEIATRVKRQFGDESGVQITDDDIIRWVNDAMAEIASNNDLLQTVATTTAVSGQRVYALPVDVLTLRSVRYAGRKLTALSPTEAEEYIQTETNGATEATHYWIYANQINLYPQPTGTGLGSLEIFYTRQPTLVTAVTATPELPLEYHNRIVEYALTQAYELDENWEAAQQKSNQFSTGLSNLKGKEEWQSTDYYPMITSLPEYDHGGAELYW